MPILNDIVSIVIKTERLAKSWRLDFYFKPAIMGMFLFPLYWRIIVNKVSLPRSGSLTSHRKGATKFKPMFVSYRFSPHKVRECINFLLKEASLPQHPSRSQVVAALKNLLEQGRRELACFIRKGVRPVEAFIRKRAVNFRFTYRMRMVVVILYENDYSPA